MPQFLIGIDHFLVASLRAKKVDFITASSVGNESFVLNSVKFDGLRNGVLSDAKSGMLNFVNSDGTFKSFFTGKDAIVSQARRQRAAAGDLPVEDIKILIDGKDFDGQDVARWKAAGGILLTVVPGGKVVGAGAKVLRPIIKVTKETNVWRVVIKNGSKTYTRIVRELTEETLAHFDRYAPGTKDLIEEALRTGKYIDTTINDAAEVIADISTKKGRTLTRTEVKALFERGRNFNRKASEVYRYNEVTLTTGKRLDTYIPNTAIISRKATTLSNIKPSTFKSYLQELINKYPRGAAINAPKFGNLFKGQTLKGDYFLEIPLSNKTFFENNAIFQKVLSDFNSANNVIVKIKYLAE